MNKSLKGFRPYRAIGLTVWFGALAIPQMASAGDAQSPAFDLSAHYMSDLVYVDEGTTDGRSFVVHEAEAEGKVDLEQVVGARGLTAGVHLLATAGGRPNEAAGTLQGIDNVEVDRHRVRLYQAWLEQAFAGGRGSLRLGLSDLNSDFYKNDSAGLLLGPAFGIGSELAATGPNGPSTFPSTALTARLSWQVGRNAYGKIAVINAKSGVLGEPDGIDFEMRDGALLIGEVGTAGRGKLALGVWGYTKSQPYIYAVGQDGNRTGQTAAGAYILAEYRFTDSDARGVHAFLRVGRSDGATTPFRGGFQAGVLVNEPIAGRPDGQLSLGVQQGQLSTGFRRLLLADKGLSSVASEWGIEFTYVDKLIPYFCVQPDIQFIQRSVAEHGERSTLVVAIRSTLTFGDN